MVDGPKGFPEAINAAFPQTLVQACIEQPPVGACPTIVWAATIRMRHPPDATQSVVIEMRI